jgi:hypothetical protein
MSAAPASQAPASLRREDQLDAAVPFALGSKSADAATGPLVQALARLEAVVDAETAALRSRAAIDLKEFNDRKSQGLLELTRAMRLFDVATADKPVLDRLAALRAKLATNRAVLGTHLEAVREIATVVADALRDAESDGTYSLSIRSGGQRP